MSRNQLTVLVRLAACPALRSRWIGAWLLLSLLAAAPMAWAQRGPAVVEVLPVAERSVSMTQPTLGNIEPTRRAIIGSAVDGRVTEFLVREGDRVEQDQPLARLLTQTIELELAAAEAELESRHQELAELKNGSRPAEIAQAEARLEASRVVAEYLDKDRLRLSALESTSAISASEFEKSISLWLEAQQRREEAQAAYELAVEGPRPERIHQAEAQVAMQQAVVERLRDQIAKHTMYSRFAGYVIKEYTEVGQWLPRGEPVAEIIALDEVDVVAKVVEANIPFIRIGALVQVEVPAIGDRKLTGRVIAIISEADERSRTFPVKIRIANELDAAGEPLLKSGMLARAELPTGNTQTALMVPKDALVLGGQTPLIFTIDADSRQADGGTMIEANATAVAVETGMEQGAWIEVRGQVRAGDLVVVRGNERIPASRPGGPPSRVAWNNPPAQSAQ